MTYSHVEIKSFKGLYIQANSFSVPDGALEQADNTVISQDGVITKRRGFSLFSNGGSSTFNALALFENFLVAIFNDKIAWLDSSGTQTINANYTGVTVSETGGRTARTTQANANLYATSDNGVLKLETYSGTVQTAGVPPALDLRARFLQGNGPIGDGSTTGVIGSTQVGWRVTFGRTDGNNNLLESAPSDIVTLTNAPITGASATWNGATATVTTAILHGLVTGMTVTIENASTAGLNGTYVVTVIDGFNFTYANATGAGAGTLDVAVSRSTILEFSVPTEIQDVSYFWRLYRSSQSLSSAASPPLDFKLIKQQNLTAGDISSGVIFFTDTILDIFQATAEELYTNPNSQEGELQAATRPPLCDDIAFYKNHTFYAAVTSRQNLNLALVSTSASFIVSGSYIEIKLASLTRRYVARTGVGNSTVTATASGTTTITVTYSAHGLLNGDTIYVSSVVGSIPQGSYVISGVAANTFQFTSTGNSATQLDFEGVLDASAHPIFELVPPGSSPATGLDSTARGLVRAINRDSSGLIYARYTSAPTEIPGKIYLEAHGFGAAFSLRADSDPTGQAFSPVLPASLSVGTQITSVNDVLPNTILSSKIGEPESVPPTNSLPIGSKNKKILRIVALRDCCIVVKEDGIFRIDGDRVTNFVSTILDSTVFCLVPSSVALIDNTVMMLSNQGVVKISSSAVQIVSYKVEQVFRAVLGVSTLLAQTSAVAYESDRLYLLTTLQPNTTVSSTVYCYNVLSDCWTTWDTLFTGGIVGPNDTLYLTTPANKLTKERKLQNRLDYAGQDYPATVVSVAGDNLSAVVNTGAVVPQAADILVYNSVISRIKTVMAASPNYAVTFYVPTNMTAASSVVLYSQYTATIKFAPFHAGQVNRSKQFSQFQIHLRDANISLLDITFATDTFGSSESVTWDASAITSQDGWGMSPWGLFPWGLEQGINLTYTTQPAPMIRTYIPKFAQRTTFIQPLIIHSTAGEKLSIQEIGYTVRGYGERVTK